MQSDIVITAEPTNQMLLEKIQAISMNFNSLSTRQNESDIIQASLTKVISPTDLAKVRRVKTYEETKTHDNELTRIQVVTTDEKEKS